MAAYSPASCQLTVDEQGRPTSATITLVSSPTPQFLDERDAADEDTEIEEKDEAAPRSNYKHINSDPDSIFLCESALLETAP